MRESYPAIWRTLVTTLVGITFGASAILTMTAGATVTGNLTPTDDSTHSIGTTLLRWKEAFVDTITADRVITDYLGENTLTVGKSGNVEFNTIQAAIDSVSDASTSNRYTVLITPGTYTETVTGKNYVTLSNVGDIEDVLITGSTGPLYTAPSTFSVVNHISFSLTPTTTGQVIYDLSAGGEHIIQDNVTRITSSTNGITASFITATDSDFNLLYSTFIMSMTGSSVGANSYSGIALSGTSTGLLFANEGVVTIGDIDDNFTYYEDNSDELARILQIILTGSITNASYSGTFIGADMKEPNTLKNFLQNDIALYGAGAGTGIGLRVDSSGSSLSVTSSFNNYGVTGFTNNVMFDVGSTDTIISSNDYQNALTPSVGAGTVNFINSQVYGAVTITGGTTFTIDTTDEWHALSNLSAGEASANAETGGGLTGDITVFADATGGQVTVTSAGHGLTDGDYITIAGTTSYNGVFQVTNVTTDTYEITDTWVANDATGTWHHGSHIIVEQRGAYRLSWAFSVDSAAANQVFDFVAFNGTSLVAGTKITRQFGTANDVGSAAGEAIINLEKDDHLFFAVMNTTSSGNITVSEGSLILTKIS